MNKTPLLDLPRNEMAFRRIYRIYLEKRWITTVFRPGRRLPGDARSYHPGQLVKAKVLDHLGLDRAKVAPIFLTHPVRLIRIELVEARTIGSLLKTDFLGSTPDIINRSSLVYHLGLIYNLDPADLTKDSVVTRICFNYVKGKKGV